MNQTIPKRIRKNLIPRIINCYSEEHIGFLQSTSKKPTVYYKFFDRTKIIEKEYAISDDRIEEITVKAYFTLSIILKKLNITYNLKKYIHDFRQDS